MQPTPKRTDPGPRRRDLSFKDILAALWRLLSHNLFLKLTSLVCAAVIWSFLIASDGTLTREKVFADVEVTVSGGESLRERGLIVLEDVQALLPKVTFKAEVPQASYNRVTGSNFGPRIDLSRLRQVGKQQVNVTMTSTSYGQVSAIEPAGLEVTVEEYVRKGRIPVNVKTTGTIRPGLWADVPKADPALVTVSGPSSLVSQVKSVSAQFDLGLLNNGSYIERNTVPLAIMDANDNEIKSKLLQVTYDGVTINGIVVDVLTYPTRTLPIDIQSAVTGELPEGYELVEVTLEPQEAQVAASQTALDGFTTLFVDSPINLDKADQTFSAPVRLKKLSEAKYYCSVDEVVVTAQIREMTLERTFVGVPVSLLGVADDQLGKLSRGKVNVTLTGPYHWVKGLTAEQIHLWVDSQGAGNGVYELDVVCQIDTAQEYLVELSHPAVTLTITPKNP